MRIINNLGEMTETARGWLSSGIVGTMTISSHLHEGHKVSFHKAREFCEILVVTLIDKTMLLHTSPSPLTNTQTILRDMLQINEDEIDILFIPDLRKMYPEGFSTYITPYGPAATLLSQCGEASSNTVRTMVTTAAKLFQLIRPDIAFFGQKDALHAAVIQQIIRDLNIDVSLHILPTVRESDGLAISSCNRFLSPEERQSAPALHRALLKAKESINSGEQNARIIEDLIANQLQAVPSITLDLLLICSETTFVPVNQITPGTLIALGASIGSVYLMDNIVWQSDGQWRI